MRMPGFSFSDPAIISSHSHVSHLTQAVPLINPLPESKPPVLAVHLRAGQTTGRRTGL